MDEIHSIGHRLVLKYHLDMQLWKIIVSDIVEQKIEFKVGFSLLSF